MSTLKQLQGDVARRMRRGDTFASVEAEVIDPSGLSDAEKAALWVYGWSFVTLAPAAPRSDGPDRRPGWDATPQEVRAQAPASRRNGVA